jgi:hypothetical protein
LGGILLKTTLVREEVYEKTGSATLFLREYALNLLRWTGFQSAVPLNVLREAGNLRRGLMEWDHREWQVLYCHSA